MNINQHAEYAKMSIRNVIRSGETEAVTRAKLGELKEFMETELKALDDEGAARVAAMPGLPDPDAPEAKTAKKG